MVEVLAALLLFAACTGTLQQAVYMPEKCEPSAIMTVTEGQEVQKDRYVCRKTDCCYVVEACMPATENGLQDHSGLQSRFESNEVMEEVTCKKFSLCYTESKCHNEGLESSQSTHIFVGTLLVMAVVSVVTFFFLKKRKKTRQSSERSGITRVEQVDDDEEDEDDDKTLIVHVLEEDSDEDSDYN